jgi:hypothetical protein
MSESAARRRDRPPRSAAGSPEAGVEERDGLIIVTPVGALRDPLPAGLVDQLEVVIADRPVIVDLSEITLVSAAPVMGLAGRVVGASQQPDQCCVVCPAPPPEPCYANGTSPVASPCSGRSVTRSKPAASVPKAAGRAGITTNQVGLGPIHPSPLSRPSWTGRLPLCWVSTKSPPSHVALTAELNHALAGFLLHDAEAHVGPQGA